MRRNALSTLVLLATALALAACGKPALVAGPHRPSHAILVRDVAVLEVETGERAEHRDVLVRAGRIAEIGAAGSVKAPVATTEIDGAGATLLPGLIDMHVHSGNPASVPWKHPLPDPERNLQAFLYAGVTTVLDTGGLDDDAIKRRDRIASGKLLGPRMYAVGPVVTEKGAHPVPMLESLPWWMRGTVISKHVRQVSDAESVRKTVAEIHGFDADFLKVAVDSIPEGSKHISDEVLEEIGRHSKNRGLRLLAHVGTTEDALDAGRAGAAAWIHGVYRERIADEKIAELAKFGIPMVPTLVVFERMGIIPDGAYGPTALERETVDADILAELDNPPKDSAAAKTFGPFLEMLKRERQDAKDNVRRLHEAGVTILAGSDSQSGVFPGASLHRELALLVESGLTPAEAIRAATIAPAKFLTRKDEPEFGRIAVGAQADLLLVEGDPTADIANVSKIRDVIRNGRRLERTPLAAPASEKSANVAVSASPASRR